jgi:hypothetical protein
METLLTRHRQSLVFGLSVQNATLGFPAFQFKNAMKHE